MKENENTLDRDNSSDGFPLLPIESLIHVIRGQQVMLDSDLARLYGVETRRLNEQVKRNIERFPDDFLIQLTKEETQDLMSQIATSSLKSQNVISSWGGSRKPPYAFTENGVAMLSSVLRSKTAIEVNIRIMRAFTAMRSFLISNELMFKRIETIEHNYLLVNRHLSEHDRKKATSSLLKTLFVCTALLASVNAMADDTKEVDDDFTHHRASITGALTSSDCYQLQLSYHYMIWRFFGVGGGFGNWQNYYEDGYASGPNWAIDGDDNKPWNLYLRPSVILKTPPLALGQVRLSLYAEPGVMIMIPYTKVCIEKTYGLQVVDYDYISTNKGQWLAVDVHLGVNADIGPCGVSIGYLMSNLDIYSQMRHLSYNGISFRDFYPRKSFTQGAYLTLSYNF